MKLVILSAIALTLAAGCNNKPNDVPSTTTTTGSDYTTPDASFVPNNSDTATMSSGGVDQSDTSDTSAGAPAPMDKSYKPGHMGRDRNGAGAAITGDGGTSMTSPRSPTVPGQTPPKKPSSGTGTATGSGNATGSAAGGH